MKLVKLLAAVGAALACAWMAMRWGPWNALAVFAGAMAVLCVGIAMIVRHQSPEKVTISNYVMGVVLPWGYRIGRGKLPAIVLTSWCIWVSIALSVVVATAARHSPSASTASTAAPAEHSTLVMILLAVAWLIDGGVLLRCVGVLATSTNRGHAARSLGPLAVFLVAILAASIALVTLYDSARAARLALLIAGGPPLLVGVGYALFLAVILSGGKKVRWN